MKKNKIKSFATTIKNEKTSIRRTKNCQVENSFAHTQLVFQTMLPSRSRVVTLIFNGCT